MVFRGEDCVASPQLGIVYLRGNLRAVGFFASINSGI
jgi:hypothetical protein